MRFLVLVVVVSACVNARHAEVPLANNPAGADCYARCVQATQGQSSVDCVAACPGAIRERGDCDGGLACVEHRTMNKGRTALLVGGGIVLFLIASSGGGQ